MCEVEKIIVGSRKSELALIQTRYVISLLKKINPNTEFEIVTMSTLGDKVLDIPLPKIGEKSLFTKELEAALSTGCVDFVVHSLKDLPTCLPPGMAIGAVLTREDPRDALVLKKNLDNRLLLDSLPADSVIGTSSLRRTAQLARKYPHLKVENIRGNLNTRLKKLDELDKYQAIILAAAGLIRMGWNSRITKILETDDILYAVGQGALAVECRALDEKIVDLLKPLYDVKTALRVIAERSFLKTLGGGCSAPVAISSQLKSLESHKFSLILKGAVWSLDGKEEILDTDACTVETKDGKRCATCPYGFQVENVDGLKDIENLRGCDKECSMGSSNDENPAKKLKLDDIPAQVLELDPHEHCPVQIPIGADFMGKCPYLESNNLVGIRGKCPVNGAIEGELSLLTQCPFMSRTNRIGQNSQITNDSGSGDSTSKKTASNKCPYRENRSYCGLVPHEDATIRALEEALELGDRLAKTLMKRGAGEVMTKAQNAIHESINTYSVPSISSK